MDPVLSSLSKHLDDQDRHEARLEAEGPEWVRARCKGCGKWYQQRAWDYRPATHCGGRECEKQF